MTLAATLADIEADAALADIDMGALVDAVPSADPVAPPTDPWLRRRMHGFGASDMAVVLVALGRYSPDLLSKGQQARAKAIRVKGLEPTPRVFLEKAGLRAPLKVGSAAGAGREREPELVAQWRRLVARGAAGPDAALVEPESIVYVEDRRLRAVLPLPLRDALSPRLTATPDVLARDILGDVGCWDGKCSVTPYPAVKWSHVVQLNTQMAVCDASHGGIVEGQGWGRAWVDPEREPLGPIVTWAVERDEALVGELREAAAEGWARVEDVRRRWEEMQG